MINVIENQSIIDVAVQEQGSALTAFEWARNNGHSITDDLFAGQQLKAPTSSFENIDVANYFKGKKQMVACGANVSIDDLPVKRIGIGAMIIENDFIIG